MKKSRIPYGILRTQLFSLIVLLQFIGCKENDEPIPKSTLECLVKDEFGGLMDSVQCKIISGDIGFSKMTDHNGYFLIDKIPIGKYTITYSKQNYVTGTEEVTVDKNPNSVELALTSSNSFLRISDSLLNINYDYYSKIIQVESNSTWTITSSAPWVKLSAGSGAGNKAVTITCEKSNEDMERFVELIFKSGSIQRKMRLIQSFKLKLISTLGVIGNYENGVSDSVKLVFNKPVSLISVTTDYYHCLSEMKARVFDKNLSFTYACAKLGLSFPFTIKVKDGSETFIFQINVKFYDGKVLMPGYVVDYFVADDNETIWAITTFPNKLLKLSISDLSIKSEYDLDFVPQNIRWNSLKNELIIISKVTPCDPELGECNNKLIWFDPDQPGIGRSKIQLGNGSDDIPNYFHPHDICLFSDGTGIIQFEDGYYYNNIGFMNSLNKDVTNLSDFFYYEYESIHSSYDKNKIYARLPWGSTTIHIYERGNITPVSWISPISGSSSSLIVVNKKNDRVYQGHLYEQFISDMNSYISKISYIDARPFYGGIDFSYKQNEDETIYYLADGLFQILDYKIGFTTFSTDTDAHFSKIQSTTDGQNLIAIRLNNEGTTDLFFFNIDRMTENEVPRPSSGGRFKINESSLKSRWIK